MDELADLLASGERAAFRGAPETGVPVLQRAVELAHAKGASVEAAVATWLLGVAYAAVGRYGEALDVYATLRPTVVEGVEPHRLASLAASGAATVHRQLGQHRMARGLDQEALGLSFGVATAAFDAHLGLAADAIGLGEPSEANDHLGVAVELAAARPEWWRQRVRRDWVRAELALLQRDPAAAVVAAGAAVALAEQSGAPRHVAKGLLYVGAGRALLGDLPGAAAALRRSARLAENLGALPIVWPARALLGRLQVHLPEEAERNLAAARSAVQSLTQRVPEELRGEWCARPDVADLLGPVPIFTETHQ